MSERADDDVLDIGFYRSYYPDLASFDDDFLRGHYEDHGRGEGRLANAAAYVAELDRLGGPLPDDLDADEYLRLNPDVAASIGHRWQAYHHFAFHGAAEGREYLGIDLAFYASLYFDGTAIAGRDALAHYRAALATEPRFRSLDEMLAHYDVPRGTWLELFEARDFRIMNYRRIASTASYEQCLFFFVSVGIPALLPFSSRYGFDLSFYREVTESGEPAATCYLDWLTVGLDAGLRATPSEWLRAHGLELAAYPDAFAWRLYDRAGRTDPGSTVMPNRWRALAALVDDRTTALAAAPPIRGGGGEFLTALAKLHLSRGDVALALACAERAVAQADASPGHRLVLADCHYAAHRWLAAGNGYRRFHEQERATLLSTCRLADALANLERYDEALAVLRAGKLSLAGERPWRQMVGSVLQRLFNGRSEVVKARLTEGDRSTAEREATELADQLYALIIDLVDLPRPVEPRGAPMPPRVVMLANDALPQCTFYRIDQKRDLFADLDAGLAVFAEADVDAFIGAVPFADVAIFYRLIATPDNLRALAAARAAGVKTVYEVDDLIFDSSVCPDDFASFEGQIALRDHVDLMYAVPLFRAMMARCDTAIASTEPLARRMAAIVGERRAFVVRNGLHHRTMTIGRDAVALRPVTGTLRVFYGSGTLNHNRDFNQLVGPALLDLMAADPRVELVIAGHLRLAPEFAGFAARIERVPFTASVDAYWSVLAGCDVNLAVLAAGPVNDCKSEIKWLEAAIFSIPSIVSATATYLQTVEPGVTALVAHDADEWRLALARLAADPLLRAAIGTAARRRAIEAYRPQVQAAAMQAAIAGTLRGAGHATAGAAAVAAAPRKRRLLVVNVFFPPQAIGGATRVVANNVDDWLDDRLLEEFDIAIAAIDHDGELAYARRDGTYRDLPVFRIVAPAGFDADWRPFDSQMGAWFDEVLGRYAPDLVHFHCIQRLTASTVEACLRRGIPYLVTAHDGWWLSDFQFLFDDAGRPRVPGDERWQGSAPGFTVDRSLDRQARLRPLLRAAAVVLTPSESFARLYVDAGFANARSLANGLTPMARLARVPSRSGRVRLGHVGNTSAHKGFDLIEAALKANDFGNLELLALDHALRDGHSIDERWGSTPVRRSAAVAPERMAEVYAGLDVLLAPSAWQESFGLVTREAHAAGLWVVAGDRGAIGEDVREGVDGFVVDVTSPAGVERALARIDADPGRYAAPVPQRPLRTAAAQAADLAALYRRLLGCA